jgi:phasin family protein
MLKIEQTVAAQRASVDLLFGVTKTAFDGVEKLMALNLQAAKTAMSEAADTAKAALSVKDAQELMALQTSLLQPVAERAAAYGRHVYDITSATSADVRKTLEGGVAQAQQKVMALIDGATSHAPAGSENVIALVRSTVAAASNAFDGVQRASRQAAEIAEANLHAMTATATKAAQSVGKGKRAG